MRNGRRRDEGEGCDADLPCLGRCVRPGRVMAHQPGSKRNYLEGSLGQGKGSGSWCNV